MIAIIDSGVANLASVQAALNRLGADSIVTDDPRRLQSADRVILPGVGAATTAMNNLHAKGLVPVLQQLQQPVLGICLGMQLLFEHSQEGTGCACLGLIKGDIRPLKTAPDAPIPHMGWNQLTLKKPDHPLLNKVPNDAFVYYVHSFAAPLNEMTIASTYYGQEFTAIVAHNNFMGCQFHPERSSATGALILKNFLELPL